MRLFFTVPDTPQTQNGVLLRKFSAPVCRFYRPCPCSQVPGQRLFCGWRACPCQRRVYPGQTVSFELPPEGEGVAPQPEISVNVVYEDAFAVVLEKPPHLAVHPTLNYPYDTLANGYAAWAAQQGISRCSAR